MTSRRAGTLSVAGVVAATGVVLLLAMLAARSGPHRVIRGTLRDPDFGDPSFSPPTQTPPPAGGGGGRGGLGQGPEWIAILTAVIAFAGLAVALVVVFLVLRQIWSSLEARRRPGRRPDPTHFDVLDDPDLLAAEIRRDASAQLAELRSGEARNAIVACWERFETQAERVGAPRLPWEASSEFTHRLLDVVAADPDAVRRLEGLYREARFSGHEVGESQREAAISALQRIHLSVRERTTA